MVVGSQVKAVTQLACCEVSLEILVESIFIIIHLIISVHVDAEVFWNIGSLTDVIELILFLISVSISVLDRRICKLPRSVLLAEGAYVLSFSISSRTALLGVLHCLAHLYLRRIKVDCAWIQLEGSHLPLRLLQANSLCMIERRSLFG